MGIENPTHILFIAAVALVVLGPKRLPEVARSLGRGIREFREAMNAGSDPASGPAHASPPPTAQPPVTPTPAPVDPPEPVRSGDAPDRRPL